MSIGLCLACSRYGSIELHHVAGRHNIAELVVPVCNDCHLVLTNWQYAAGIELREDAARTPVDIRRALGVGFLHIIRLICQRQPHFIPGRDDLWRLTARTVSRIADLSAPPDRPGRWLPDSSIDPHTAVPVVVDPRTEDAWVREVGYLIGSLIRLFGDRPPLTADVWDRVVAASESMPDRLVAVDVKDHPGPTLAILIEQHLRAALRVMQWMLTVDDWTVIDDVDLAEARLWLDTGERILLKIVDAATLDGAA